MRLNLLHPLVSGTILGIALCLGSATAGAQQEASEPPKPERVNYASGHVWMGSGLGASVAAIDGDASGMLIALSTEGAVYRRPAGGTWREVLGPTGIRLDDGVGIDEEEILLDAEGFLDELEEMNIEFEPGFDEEDVEETDGDDP